ncbi:MAG TPA: M12 family metallo-peptidase [Phycisphaerae bacterium]|nr:M12 family metallo-peptidase [Phycisphaerae bacterium]HRW53537.1 M12 family metallo-peptidase [Phycisphaerae bacterium]
MSLQFASRLAVCLTFSACQFAMSAEKNRPSDTSVSLDVTPAVAATPESPSQISHDVQDLAPTWDADGDVTLDVRLGDRNVTLNLRPYSIRAAGFELVTYDADGNPSSVEAPAPNTYRGTIGFDASTRVAASIVGGQVTAMLRDDRGEVWAIQLASEFGMAGDVSAHVVYAADASLEQFGDCGTMDIAAGATPGGAPRGSNTSCEPIVANLALLADHEYYQYQGASITATTNAMETVVNAMTYIYEEELGITYELIRVDIWSGGNAFIVVPDVNGEVDHNILLEAFKNWYNANLPGVNRRLTHMFSGRNFVGSVIGLAVVGVICSPTSAYGIDQMNSGNLVRNAGLLSHEAGHNWGAGHCNGTPGCDIMNSALGAPTTFGEQATNQIIGPGAPIYSCYTAPVNPGQDCNHNGECDDVEIAMGWSMDANGTGVPDQCEAVHNTTQGVYYKSIRDAVREAVDGDTIVVAPGSYYEGVDMRGRNITLRSSNGVGVTEIDVTGLGTSGVAMDRGTLHGFTIRGASGGVVYSNAGGCVEVTAGTPLIRQCIIRDAQLPGGFLGGGVFAHDGALPTLQTVTFCNNAPQAIWGNYTNQGVAFPTNCLPFFPCATTAGDVNGDHVVNGWDITSFVECYLDGESSYGDCDCADIVTGGGVNDADVQAFIGLLVSQ